MIKLQIEENTLIAERNRLLKATTKGYLDAVVAQAFGAGKFQKILVEQDRNLGMALVKGIARKNPALGLTGADARGNDISPFRFSGNMARDATGLQRYAEALRRVWEPFIKELRGVFIPPIPSQRISPAVSSGRSRILRGKMNNSPGADLADVGEMLQKIGAKLDARLIEHDEGLQPRPEYRPGSLPVSL